MSDRLSLLAAIRAHPDDDTPRLLYADWLDEREYSHDSQQLYPPEGEVARDTSRAIAEFIRVSCRPGSKPGYDLPRPANLWLKANWKRLVPSLVAEHRHRHAGEVMPEAKVVAGRVSQWFRFARPRPRFGFRNGDPMGCARVVLTFARGTITGVRCPEWAEQLIGHCLRCDGYAPIELSWALVGESRGRVLT